MRGRAAYFFAGIVGALALATIALALGAGFSVNAGPAAPRDSSIQVVDRTHKGDRLPVAATTVDKDLVPSRPQKVMIGCDLAFSPLTESPANFAGRCAA